MASISPQEQRTLSGFPLSAKKGWLLVTKDKKIRYNELEKAAVLHYRVRAFYFSSGNYNGAEMAEILAAALPEMVRICRKQGPPFIASITKSGKVNLRLS